MYILLNGVTHLLSHPMLYSDKIWWTLCGLKVMPRGKESALKRATCRECDKGEQWRRQGGGQPIGAAESGQVDAAGPIQT